MARKTRNARFTVWRNAKIERYELEAAEDTARFAGTRLAELSEPFSVSALESLRDERQSRAWYAAAQRRERAQRPGRSWKRYGIADELHRAYPRRWRTR